MNWLIVVLRFLHIFAGVFWAGSAFVVAGFILPTVAVSGPEGGRFMRRLALERGLTPWMVAAGITTVVAGMVLMWIDSAGLQRTWMGSGVGVMISIGALAGIGAIVTGIHAAAMVSRLGKVLQAIDARGSAPSPELVAQAQQFQPRLAARARAVAVQLAIAVACMAVARYVVF